MPVNNGEPTHPEQWSAGYDAGYEDGAMTSAATVSALQEQLRHTEAKYTALLKAVADGVAMQPKTVVLNLGPNVRANRPAEGQRSDQ